VPAPSPSSGSPSTLRPAVAGTHIALIEGTWRLARLLATLATRQTRYENIDDLVAVARNAMRRIMTDDPDRTPPGKAPSPGRRQPKGKERHVRVAVPPNPEPASVEEHDRRAIKRARARSRAGKFTAQCRPPRGPLSRKVRRWPPELCPVPDNSISASSVLFRLVRVCPRLLPARKESRRPPANQGRGKEPDQPARPVLVQATSLPVFGSETERPRKRLVGVSRFDGFLATCRERPGQRLLARGDSGMREGSICLRPRGKFLLPRRPEDTPDRLPATSPESRAG
jgi:hypothetical protein